MRNAALSALGFRLGGRAVQIYAAHILISALALALLAATAYFLDNPLILDWHNAAAFFQDPRTCRWASCCSRISSATSTSCRCTWC